MSLPQDALRDMEKVPQEFEMCMLELSGRLSGQQKQMKKIIDKLGAIDGDRICTKHTQEILFSFFH